MAFAALFSLQTGQVTNFAVTQTFGIILAICG